MPASPEPPPADQPPVTFDLTLEEFCRRLSGTENRVEMIAGFYSDEARANHWKDSEAAFTARFDAFQIRPA